MRKKRILHVGEASFLNSGYSTYAKEILERLYNTGKYEISELGCYARSDDPKAARIPWNFYGNLPDPNHAGEVEYYNSSSFHQFGSWKFEEISLQVKPDFVFSIRDWIMDEFFERSPFRRYFHLTLMPTVDSIPQHPQWLSTYMNADAVFTYSNWGFDVLNRTDKLIKLVSTASPGNNINLYKPISDKSQHKMSFGLHPDDIVIGTVMRNQPRKLYPDLIKSFRMFLEQAPKSLAERTYLYMHTSYPDWWVLPDLMLEHGVSHKCLLTYKCQACEFVFSSRFRDARTTCRRCGKSEALIPNTHMGLDRRQLSVIYNLFDVYVQYSSCEGFGMPVVEAASCGVHPFVVDFSAMEDFKKTLKATSINVLHFNREGDNGTDRAVPDNQDLVNKLIKHLHQLPQGYQNKKSADARSGVEKYYNWDKTAEVWEKHFDNTEIPDQSHTWNSPLKIHTPPNEIPINLPAEEFVEWAMLNVAGRPDLCNHYVALRLLRDIQWKSTTEKTSNIVFNELSAIGARPKRKDFSREDLIVELRGLADYMNYWERKRWEEVSK